MSDQTRKLDAGKAPLWLVPWEVLETVIPREAQSAAKSLHDWCWRRGKISPVFDPDWAIGAAHVLAFGAKKYSPGGWERGIEFTRVAAAGLRHALEFGTVDPESGFPHEYHLACNLIFAATFEARGLAGSEFDDRPGVAKESK